MRKSFKSARAQSGQGMLEYVLIVVFVAVAGIVVWRTFGDQIKSMVSQSSNAVGEQSEKIFDDYDNNRDN